MFKDSICLSPEIVNELFQFRNEMPDEIKVNSK